MSQTYCTAVLKPCDNFSTPPPRVKTLSSRVTDVLPVDGFETCEVLHLVAKKHYHERSKSLNRCFGLLENQGHGSDCRSGHD